MKVKDQMYNFVLDNNQGNNFNVYKWGRRFDLLSHNFSYRYESERLNVQLRMRWGNN